MLSIFFPSYWQMKRQLSLLNNDNHDLRKRLSAQERHNAELERKNEEALALICKLNQAPHGGERRRDERGRYCR